MEEQLRRQQQSWQQLLQLLLLLFLLTAAACVCVRGERHVSKSFLHHMHHKSEQDATPGKWQQPVKAAACTSPSS